MPKASEGSKAGRQEAGGFHQGVRVQADVGRDHRALRETQQSKAQGNCWVSQGLDPTYATLDRGDAGGVWFLEHSHDKIRITPLDDCPRLLILPACASGYGGYSCSRSRLPLSAADLGVLHSARRLTNRAIPAFTSLRLMITLMPSTPSTPCTMRTMMTARRKNRRPIRRAS